MSVRIKELSKSYQMGEVKVKALDEVSFNVEQGEFIVVLGPSGCGKTTLLNLVGGIDKSTSGTIHFDNQRSLDIFALDEGELTKYRRKNVGFIFQFYNLVASLTALENVEIAANLTNKTYEAKKLSESFLKEVGLEDKLQKFPGQLSGGEQQRVAIARALAKEPKLLLADEPTGNIDSETTAKLMKIFKRINQEHDVTIIMVTHNVGLSYLADRVIYLRDGKVFGTSKHDPEKEAEFWENVDATPGIEEI